MILTFFMTSIIFMMNEIKNGARVLRRILRKQLRVSKEHFSYICQYDHWRRATTYSSQHRSLWDRRVDAVEETTIAGVFSVPGFLGTKPIFLIIFLEGPMSNPAGRELPVIGLFSYFSPISSWSGSDYPPKDAGQMDLISESAIMRDLGNGRLRVREQMPGTIDPATNDELIECQPSLLLE